MRLLGKKLGAGIGTLALGASFLIGFVGLTSGVASADPTGAINCTVTDNVSLSSVTFVSGPTYPVTAPSGALTGVAPGDTITMSCTGLAASESVAGVEANALAALDHTDLANDFADLGALDLATASAGGVLSTVFTVPSPFTSTATTDNPTVATCPVSQAAANAGALHCLITVADITSQHPLFLIDLNYTGDATPQNPAVSVTPFSNNSAANSNVSFTTTSGSWWGAAEFGTGGVSPIPNPTALLDGVTPLTNTLTVSASNYLEPTTLTNPVLSGSATIPSATAVGSHSVTVAEGTIEAGSISATNFEYEYVGTPVQVNSLGNIGPNQGFNVQSNGWDGDPGAVSFSGVYTSPTLVSYPAVTLTPTPASPVAPVGTESFGLNTGDLGVNFAAGAWTLAITEKVGATTVATESVALTFVNLAFTCSIAHTGTCLVQQNLSVNVIGTQLTVTEYQQGANPDQSDVTLSPVTLGPDVFQAAQGVLNTVQVSDDRGTLGGWSVTGTLENDFQGPAIGNDHSIPADYLTWAPAVSLTFAGNEPAGVVPNGTPAPGPYGPHAPAAGTPGTNHNILAPSVNDNDGTPPYTSGGIGPSGLINEVGAGPIGNLGTNNLSAPDHGIDVAQVLCDAPSGGGGGGFDCDAALSLAVPPYIAAGTYTAVLDLVTTAS